MKDKYRRMLDVLSRKPDSGPAEWSVYVLRCSDGTLYTGITNNVEARLLKHNSGKGAAYTRTRAPVALYYKEEGFTRSAALVREAEIKRMPKIKKEELAKPG